MMRRFLLHLSLVVLATPSPVAAETTVYFIGYAMEVAPPIMLLVGGLALIAVGVAIRKFRRTPAPEPEFVDDVPSSPTSPPVIVVPNLVDAEHSTPSRADLAEIGRAVRRADPE
jgi:hypothetical protein